MRVLFICKLDVITKNILERMKEECEVLQCEFSSDEVRRNIRTEKPDIIFVSYDELIDDMTFCNLLDDAEENPVLVMCNKEDHIAKKHRGPNLEFIFRPVKMDDIIGAMRKMLNIEDEPSSKADNSEAAEVEIDDSRPGILAIDDNPQILRGIKKILKDEYKVALATNVEIALAQLDKNEARFDLILLDYEMPDVDGLTALQLIKSDPKLLNIPVVFLTGVSDKERVMKVVQYNVDAYLLKPINAEQLVETVRGLISKSYH